MGGQAMAHMTHIEHMAAWPRVYVVVVMAASVARMRQTHTPNTPMFGRKSHYYAQRRAAGLR